MVDTIICEVGTIMCDIGTINVRFYLLEVRYPHGYYRITLLTKVGLKLKFYSMTRMVIITCDI
jgi:hypothetical protein